MAAHRGDVPVWPDLLDLQGFYDSPFEKDKNEIAGPDRRGDNVILHQHNR